MLTQMVFATGREPLAPPVPRRAVLLKHTRIQPVFLCSCVDGTIIDRSVVHATLMRHGALARVPRGLSQVQVRLQITLRN